MARSCTAHALKNKSGQWRCGVGGVWERGLAARYHGGSVREQWTLKKAEPWVRASEFLTNIFSNLSRPVRFSSHTMEMKKRISLELRNRTPAEVRSWTFNYLFSPRNDVRSQPVCLFCGVGELSRLRSVVLSLRSHAPHGRLGGCKLDQ